MPAAWLPPLARRPLLVFAALVALLLAPWPGWGRAFGVLFSAFGNGLVTLAGATGDPPPWFEAPAPGQVSAEDGGAWAVVLRAGDQALPLDTRIIAYTPLAIFLALALATPVPRRRKLVVLGGGLAFLLARLAFAVLVPLERAFGGGASGSALGTLAGIAWTVLVTPPVMSYAAPLAAWGVAVALTTPRAAVAQERASRRRRPAPSRTSKPASR
jgi:hypothetical protein